MLALSIQTEQQQQTQQESPLREQHPNPQLTIPPELRTQESQVNQANTVGMTEQELFE